MGWRGNREGEEEMGLWGGGAVGNAAHRICSCTHSPPRVGPQVLAVLQLQDGWRNSPLKKTRPPTASDDIIMTDSDDVIRARRVMSEEIEEIEVVPPDASAAKALAAIEAVEVTLPASPALSALPASPAAPALPALPASPAAPALPALPALPASSSPSPSPSPSHSSHTPFSPPCHADRGCPALVSGRRRRTYRPREVHQRW